MTLFGGEPVNKFIVFFEFFRTFEKAAISPVKVNLKKLKQLKCDVTLCMRKTEKTNINSILKKPSLFNVEMDLQHNKIELENSLCGTKKNIFQFSKLLVRNRQKLYFCSYIKAVIF